MRAIDADALMKDVRENSESYFADDFAEFWVNRQPTIQSEPHWIPVEQDLPTEDDDYWATFDAETGRFVDWASWYQGRWVTWIEGSPAPLSNVIAWCKPFEPYKGVTE